MKIQGWLLSLIPSLKPMYLTPKTFFAVVLGPFAILYSGYYAGISTYNLLAGK
jgi:hypothetical protein